MLINFCRRNGLVVTNSVFQHHKRRRYTWKMPGDGKVRYQLDYILVKSRYRNSVKDSRAYPGADVKSDHNLVMMKCRLRFKKPKRKQRQKKWCLDAGAEKKALFTSETGTLSKTEFSTVEEKWQALKNTIKQKAESTIGYANSNNAKKPWVTDEMLLKMDERTKVEECGKRRQNV